MIKVECTWADSPEDLKLEQGMIHIWRLYIPAVITRVANFSGFLTAEEQLRANRFKNSAARDSFTIGRGVLRHLIGRYTQTPPEKVPIAHTHLGKPYLVKRSRAGRSFSFNLSHSGQWLVFAFSSSRTVGIDIEQHKENIQSTEIAQRFFAPGEIELLLQFEGERRQQIFYELWVRKEACLKALGTGLSRSLRDLNLPFAEGIPCFFYLPNQKDCAEAWWLCPVSVDPVCSCALVSHPPPETVHYFQWVFNE